MSQGPCSGSKKQMLVSGLKQKVENIDALRVLLKKKSILSYLIMSEINLTVMC